jgi:murein DD-endopeptidase MepM/ murein hydrolase activator NlpD
MSRPVSRPALAGLLVFLALASGTPVGAQSPDVKERGRLLTRLFFSSQLDSLHATFNPQMSRFLDLRNLNIFRDQVEGQMGAESKLIEERVTPQDTLQIYTRLAHFQKYDGLVEVVWTLDTLGRVAGFSVRSPQSAHPSRFDDYQTRTTLRLPFTGSWFVVWGGRSLRENRHAAAPDQRFASDFILRKGTVSHDGDGSANAQFYAFGQPIVAPGAGTVVAVVNDVDDNVPGAVNRDHPFGNYVVLDHGNGEFSFLAHFEKGTVAVRQGQKVKSGATLARCGNSGHSTEPHLHYHMQTTAVPFAGEGLPVQFVNYRADSTDVKRGEPHQMQNVAQP